MAKTKSYTIDFSRVDENSIVRVAQAPAIFGRDKPGFYIKYDKDSKEKARGFAFCDGDVARKFATEFMVTCYHSNKEKTFEVVKALYDAMEKEKERKNEQS